MVIIFGFPGKKYVGKIHKNIKIFNIDRQFNLIDLNWLNYLKEIYVFKGFKSVIKFLHYVFLNLNFKQRHIDLHYLGPIATTILMLNLKVNLKYINEF